VELALDTLTGEPVTLELRNVAFCPDSRCNIVSLSLLTEMGGLYGTWGPIGVILMYKDKIVGTACLVLRFVRAERP
jgi:hypothetical protein